MPSGSGGRRIQSGKNEKDEEEDEEGFYPLGLYPQLRNEMKLSITQSSTFFKQEIWEASLNDTRPKLQSCRQSHSPV